MIYLATTHTGAKVLVSSRCQTSAIRKVEQRLDTRVVSLDYLEAAIHSQFDNLAYVLGVDTIPGEVP